jgi:hypothetical protein
MAAYALRRALVVLGILAFAWVASGCASSARDNGAVGTSGQANNAIVVKTSQLYVTVENRAGSPLVDTQIVIDPVGAPLSFSRTIARIENGEAKDVAVADFRSQDGTSLNRGFVRPKKVTVKAEDLTGKKYEVSVPWQ